MKYILTVVLVLMTIGANCGIEVIETISMMLATFVPALFIHYVIRPMKIKSDMEKERYRDEQVY